MNSHQMRQGHSLFSTQMFDSNDDGVLNFEEFLMATSAKGNGAAPEEKLEWLFDHVYDKVLRGFVG